MRNRAKKSTVRDGEQLSCRDSQEQSKHNTGISSDSTLKSPPEPKRLIQPEILNDLDLLGFSQLMKNQDSPEQY